MSSIQGAFVIYRHSVRRHRPALCDVLVRFGLWVPFAMCLAAWCLGSAAFGCFGAETTVRSIAVSVQPRADARVGFSQLTASATGILFTNVLAGDAYLTNAVAHNGSGVAIGDVDGDGWADIYLCRLQGPNELYRNLGQLKFEVMAIGDAACAGQMSTGAAFADVDGDGDLDLLVNGISAGTRLFLNDGRGRWTEKRDAGLSRGASSTSMALADMDGDGDLDLYCAQYTDYMHLVDPTTRFAMGQRDGRWVVAKVNDVPTTDPRYKDRFEVMPDGEIRENPEADALYRNDGGGRFTAIQGESGVFLDESGQPVPPPRDWGLAVVFRDLDGNGIPDIYVSNDYASPDRFWINDGRGHFRAVDPLKLRHTAYNSMGIDVADVDRDGLDDILVVDLLATRHERRQRQLAKTPPDPKARESVTGRPQFNRNMLYLGRPGATFVEAALWSGIAASEWSWSPVFLDVDLDGYEDLLVTNGFEFDLMDQDTHDRMQNPKQRPSREQMKRWMQNFPQWRSPNLAFRNRGDGTFEPKSKEWNFDQEGLSSGMALGDLDNDGDLDVVVNHINSAASVYRNEASGARVGVRLRGAAPNTGGIGARVRLLGPSITQGQEMISGGRYLSSDQAMRVFAADLPKTNALTVEVRWRNGRISRVTNIEPNHIYEVSEGPARPDEVVGVVDVKSVSPLFEDMSLRLNHELVGEAFEDAVLQPLIPRRFSRLGVGVGWFDLNGDGWEDLVIGAPRNGLPSVFQNFEGRGFAIMDAAAVPGGHRGIVGWPDGRGARKWLAATANLNANQEVSSQLTVQAGLSAAPMQRLEIGKESVGPLATGDFDGDGDLDLFVGGQYRPGRYPEPVRSTLWINDAGTLRPAAKAGEPLASLGFVSGATWADLDGDGDQDLAIAVEWGPIRLFRNQGGVLEDVTAAMGLAGRTGWWSGITAGDFDGDGRVDLAVGNVGRNTAYELFQPSPMRLYFGEWLAPGRTEILEAWQRDGRWLPVKNRRLLAASLPDLTTRCPTHEAFGRSTVPEILGASDKASKFVEVVELSSGILLNRGSKLEWRPLPREAQLSPVFSMNVGDVDGDGAQDLFLSQNRSDLLPELSRDDSGLGLWLRGKGDGNFEVLGATQTGIAIHGEQRAAALADFDHDGRVDVVVTQINGPTRLFANRRGKPGVRVVLEGPVANPDGVGAQVRLAFSEGSLGPVSVVQGGSGYGSHDSATSVLGFSTPPSAVRVRWSGGRDQVAPLKAGQMEIRIRYEGR